MSTSAPVEPIPTIDYDPEWLQQHIERERRSASVVLTAVMLFSMGALKSRWTRRNWLRSGFEIFALGAFAGIAGYAFGTLFPAALGVARIAG